MSKLTDAVARLAAILTPPVGGTNETKIFAPRVEDKNAALKERLIDRAANAVQLGRASIGGLPMKVQLVENELFSAIDRLPDDDAEKPDYFELINATQAVLEAVNNPAA